MRTYTPSVIVKRTSPLKKLYLLPPFIKYVLAIVVFFLIVIVGFIYFKNQSDIMYSKISNQKMQLESEVGQSAHLFGQTQFISKNTSTAKEEYGRLLSQFPTENQVGDLLANITKLGTKNGLKFVSFKPADTIKHDYYAQEPVQVMVTGRFHQIATFLSDIANLPNSVVSVNQFELKRLSAVQTGNDYLSLEFTATIYYTLPNSADIKV